MFKKNDPNYFLNPKTNRYFKKGSPTYNKLFTDGFFNEKPQIVEPIVEIEPIVEAVCDSKLNIKPIIKSELKTIIKDNKNDFVGLNQRETDELLKRMLYEKLFLNKKQPKVKNTKKTKKSKKYKVQSSSSDSSSESDSNSS